MRRGDQVFLFSKSCDYYKWFDNQSVTMLLSNVERITTISTVLQCPKKSASNVWTVFPDAIKMHNQDVGGVDLVYQNTTVYNLDCKSSIRFCLRISLDSMNIACAGSFISTTWCTRMSLLCLTSKPSFPPIWLVVIQTEAECHQRIKLDQKENTEVPVWAKQLSHPSPRISVWSQMMCSL